MEITVGRLRECASAVLKHTLLRDVHVARLGCQGSMPLVAGPFDVESDLSVKAVQVEGEIHSYSLYEVHAEAENGRPAWSITLEMVGSWETGENSPKFTQEQLTCFSLAIGSMTIHPYAREAVQSAVSRMGYPPFTMDMIQSPTSGNDDELIEIEFPDEATS